MGWTALHVAISNTHFDMSVFIVFLTNSLVSTIGIILSVCLSVCDDVHCGAQGRCRGVKIVLSCDWEGTSYSLLHTLLLYDVSFSFKTQCFLKKLTGRKHSNRLTLWWASYTLQSYCTVLLLLLCLCQCNWWSPCEWCIEPMPGDGQTQREQNQRLW